MKAMLIPFALMLLACTPEAPATVANPSGLIPMSFTASSETPTRTTLSSTYGILWSSSDAVTLFASTGTEGSTFKVSSTQDGGSVATFTGLSPQTSNSWYYAL